MLSKGVWCIYICFNFHLLSQVTKDMAGVVKGMDAVLKTMNLEKVGLMLPCWPLIG